MLYAIIVLSVAVFLHDKDGRVQEQIVLHSSTNISNLHHSPIYVLVVSAFVVPSITGLWVLVPLVVLFGAAQRWLGRIPAFVVAAIGHVLATLFVAVLIAAGITHGRLAASAAHDPDVGVSYAVATIAAFLVAVVPLRFRAPYLATLVIVYAVPMVFAPTFTDVGHLTSVLLGLGLAVIAKRASDADGTQPVHFLTT